MRLAPRLLALILATLLANTSVRAQLTVEPQSLSVAVPQHETVERTVMLTNTGTEPLTFCLSFARPLQRSVEGGTSGLRLSAEVAAVSEDPCGEYGEVLHRLRDEDVGVSGWLPFGLAMTPEGRLFTSSSSGLHRTFELTPTLEYVRHFEHPFVEEVAPFSDTDGIAFDEMNETMWWLNRESYGNDDLRRVMLLEGDLDGNPTGQRIQLYPAGHPDDELGASGPSYDVATDLFYFIGGEFQGEDLIRSLWAVNRKGVVPEGYPVPQTAYPDYEIGRGVDAHGGVAGGSEGVRIETAIQTPPAFDFDRIVVLDRWGNSEGEALETPVPAEILGPDFGGIRGDPLRSRLDPNGVMYMTFVNFDDEGIVGVRPHPLPPSWLVVDSDEGPEAAWDGTLDPSESWEVLLRFRAGAREVGTYTSSLQAFEAESGEAVEVPLSLTVTEGTDAEDGAEPKESSLAVYPNPSRGVATVAVTRERPGEVRVRVVDVLGRTVAVLHDGPLTAGSHRLTFDGADLPAGTYLIRATGEGFSAVQRVTLVR